MPPMDSASAVMLTSPAVLILPAVLNITLSSAKSVMLPLPEVTVLPIIISPSPLATPSPVAVISIVWLPVAVTASLIVTVAALMVISLSVDPMVLTAVTVPLAVISISPVIFRMLFTVTSKAPSPLGGSPLSRSTTCSLANSVTLSMMMSPVSPASIRNSKVPDNEFIKSVSPDPSSKRMSAPSPPVVVGAAGGRGSTTFSSLLLVLIST